MAEPGVELSARARYLLYASAVVYLAVGVPLFVAPDWASQHFAWKVSPFVAMTAGGWCIGTAAFAFLAAHTRRCIAVRAAVVYVASFGVTQLGVALYERDRLITDEALSWPYLIALVLSIVAGAVALFEGRRWLRPDRRDDLLLTSTQRRLRTGFIGLVFFLALVALVAPERATNGSIFPEPLSLFSLRAFGVFYMSLGIGMLAIGADRNAEAFLVFMRAGLILVIPILVATVVYAESFDMGEHPVQVVYPLAYIVALVGAAGSLLWERRQAAPRSKPDVAGV